MADGTERPFPLAGRYDDLNGVWRRRQFRGNGRDDRDLAVLVADVVLDDEGRHRDLAVLVADVVLDDEGRPRLLDLVAAGWIKFDEVEIPSLRKRHVRLVLVVFFGSRAASNVRQASSSSGNHSAAIARSRSALAR